MRIIIVCSVMLSLILSSCGERQKEPKTENISEPREVSEVAKSGEGAGTIEVQLIDTDGVDVGHAFLKEDDNGVHIDLEAHHLPVGLHGIHIHERGLCELPDFDSAGGHFNPDGKQHGFNDPDGPHAGDLENIEVDESGTVKQSLLNNRVTLKKGKKHSLITKEGSALIIHMNEDDYITQPAGNSGERLVCGVISPYERS